MQGRAAGRQGCGAGDTVTGVHAKAERVQGREAGGACQGDGGAGLSGGVQAASESGAGLYPLHTPVLSTHTVWEGGT